MKKYPHVFLLLACASVWGVESVSTPTLVGNKPTVESVRLDNTSPMFGETVKVNYVYKDIDGDVEGASIIKWLYNGSTLTGETGRTYTPVLNINTGVGKPCTTAHVAAEVTPISLTGVPNIGNTRRTATATIRLATIPNFTFPTTNKLSWSDAGTYCATRGYRLPTSEQLQFLFKNYIDENEVASVSVRYGWPLNKGWCGGSSYYYWTRDRSPTPSGAYVINMETGRKVETIESFAHHVTCVRD
ncbi:hypothetical protein [Aeromonas veronii]|uniref:hypothetical protein n=1 Tax=Aeromonas veronii TaxID=654 RepID=UPI000D9418D3